MASTNGTDYDTAGLETLSQHNRRLPGRDEIRSAAISLTLVTTHIADKVRALALKGTALAERVGSSWASRRRVAT
jgi:hypothetical protein